MAYSVIVGTMLLQLHSKTTRPINMPTCGIHNASLMKGYVPLMREQFQLLNPSYHVVFFAVGTLCSSKLPCHVFQCCHAMFSMLPCHVFSRLPSHVSQCCHALFFKATGICYYISLHTQSYPSWPEWKALYNTCIYIIYKQADRRSPVT